MTSPLVIDLTDGRELEVHEAGTGEKVLLWHNGSPHTGAVLPPVLAAAQRRGLRVVTYARPSYAGSSPTPGRTVGDAAAEVEQLVDSLGIDRFVTVGYSGGGPHALAVAAVLGDRVSAVVTLASVAPFTESFDWFAGMHGPEDLRAAHQGRDARAKRAELDEFDPEIFTPADWAALEGEWGVLGADANAAGEFGNDGLIDDDVAFTLPWGVDLSRVAAPTLLVQGADDRIVPPSHAEYLATLLPHAELWLRPGLGHVSIVTALADALDWAVERS
jgi:pimeloyl-ACP methyl ester carboxylesterase